MTAEAHAPDEHVARGTLKPCQVHPRHTPKSHINERHHVWPLGMGGPDTAANVVVVCATGHNSIHDLIGLLRKHKGSVPYPIWRTYTANERRLALLGLRRAQEQRMIPDEGEPL